MDFYEDGPALMTADVPWPPGWQCARAHDWTRWHWPTLDIVNATCAGPQCACGAHLIPRYTPYR